MHGRKKKKTCCIKQGISEFDYWFAQSICNITISTRFHLVLGLEIFIFFIIPKILGTEMWQTGQRLVLISKAHAPAGELFLSMVMSSSSFCSTPFQLEKLLSVTYLHLPRKENTQLPLLHGETKWFGHYWEENCQEKQKRP